VLLDVQVCASTLDDGIARQEGFLMKTSRRQCLHLAIGAAALPMFSRLAAAQAYPSRPVRLIATFPAGGVVDLYARLIAQSLSERLGQTFFVENRAGAGGNTGTEAAVRAAPDGYTLVQLSSANAWGTALYGKLSFDFIRDIAPIASIYRSPGILVVHPAFPVRSVPELIAYARANPGQINMASGGVGSAQHVYGELFKSMADVNMLHVPYRGGGPALADLLAGQVPLMFDTLSTSIEHVRAGKLRALAVTSLERIDVLPELPAIAEFVPGFQGVGWQGVGAPRNTPPEIIDKLNREINASLADPRLKSRIADFGATIFAGTPAEFGAYMAEYTAKWTKVIRGANINLE
jgi:tripartite-type tricarboxylate transporter receptor subunit TctC